MNRKVALYLRVSTNQQTVENQRLELLRYCERQDWQIVKTYEDTGFSGSKSERPALQAMLKDASAGKFAVLVCWKIDRMARSTADLLSILTALRSCGVDFVSTTQAIDTSTSYGKMVMTFLGAIAEFERDTTIERVRSGLERARTNGVRLGRPRVGFDVNRALKLKLDGLSWAETAKELGVSVSTVRRVVSALLKNPARKTP